MSKEDDFFDDFDVDLELGEDDNIEIDEHMNEDDLLMELDEMINQWNRKEREKNHWLIRSAMNVPSWFMDGKSLPGTIRWYFLLKEKSRGLSFLSSMEES